MMIGWRKKQQMNGKQMYTEDSHKSRIEVLQERYGRNPNGVHKSALESELGTLESKYGECWCCEYGEPYYVLGENKEPINKNTLLTRCKCKEENSKKESMGVVARVRNKQCEHWKLRSE